MREWCMMNESKSDPSRGRFCGDDENEKRSEYGIVLLVWWRNVLGHAGRNTNRISHDVDRPRWNTH